MSDSSFLDNRDCLFENEVGFGNIYASEALFISGIHPKRKANRIKNLISL